MSPTIEPLSTRDMPARSASEIPARDILYVDDDAPLRGLLADALQAAGFHVDVAGDGQAGWEALQRRGYDLLITDHAMPSISGMDLIRRLRSAGRTMPVILASGGVEEAEAERLEWLWISATLRKPFTPSALLETVHRVLCAAAPVPKCGRPSEAMAVETFFRIQPVQHWGINE